MKTEKKNLKGKNRKGKKEEEEREDIKRCSVAPYEAWDWTLRGVTSPLRRLTRFCCCCCCILDALVIICSFLRTFDNLVVIILITIRKEVCQQLGPRATSLERLDILF